MKWCIERCIPAGRQKWIMRQKVKFCGEIKNRKKERSQAGFGHSSRIIRFKCGEDILDLLNSASVEKKTQSVLK